MNIDPREWDLQERAARETGSDAAAPREPSLAAYRAVAEALRRSPGEPPADFAAAVAALAPAAPARASRPAAAAAGTPEGRIERWLLRAMAAVMVGSGIGAVAIYGRDWLGGFDAIAPALGGASALNWALAAGACMALSWAFAKGAPRV